MRESHIMHESAGGRYWVGKVFAGYAVFKTGLTHSESSVTFAPDADGLSLAIAHCDYKAKRAADAITRETSAGNKPCQGGCGKIRSMVNDSTRGQDWVCFECRAARGEQDARNGRRCNGITPLESLT